MKLGCSKTPARKSKQDYQSEETFPRPNRNNPLSRWVCITTFTNKVKKKNRATFLSSESEVIPLAPAYFPVLCVSYMDVGFGQSRVQSLSSFTVSGCWERVSPSDHPLTMELERLWAQD